MHEVFEKEMRASHPTFDLSRDRDGYADDETNAMWGGFCLAWKEAERLRGIIDRVISTSKVLAEKSPSTPWGDGYKECAVGTGHALEDMLRLGGKA